MKTKMLAVGCLGLLGLVGCSKVNSVEAAAAAPVPGTTAPEAAPEAGPAAAPAPVPVILPAGTRVRVRLLDTLDTQRNRTGDRFTATLDEPLVVGNRVVVPKGTDFYGHVTYAKPSGRFKGRAILSLSLDSFALDGTVKGIRSTSASRVSANHKKHNSLWIGGGSGAGAGIGAIAGGGVGAAIGAGAGAAAGTVGSLVTGKKNVVLPVESELTFTLQSAVDVRS